MTIFIPNNFGGLLPLVPHMMLKFKQPAMQWLKAGLLNIAAIRYLIFYLIAYNRLQNTTPLSLGFVGL